MNKPIPNKWVKKAVFEALHNLIVVDEITNEVLILENQNGDDLENGSGQNLASSASVTIPCYDVRVTANGGKAHYILMHSQTNVVNKYTKCEYAYESTILIEVVTSYDTAGNPSLSLLADNILDKVRQLTNNLTLDIESGLTIHRQTQDFPTSNSIITDTENIYRTFMRLELFIN